MTLIKSISGIRGTIGGQIGENLTPLDIVKFTVGYSQWLKKNNPDKQNLNVVVGRDGRISGNNVRQIIINTLSMCGISVYDIDYATTPTTEMAVTGLNADGGIIITASHNPKQWNALKLLNKNGEFVNSTDGKYILEASESVDFNFADVDSLGKISQQNYLDQHINKILSLKLVDTQAIKQANFKVCADVINSVGGIALPKLFKALGVENFTIINSEVSGEFNHNPEPLKENLTELAQKVVSQKADVGFAVDPDVDRLAIMCEDGEMFGEEYTLVAVADYVLQQTKGNTVSNLSSSRALKDVTEKHGGKYSASAVGELNVVAQMKQTNAIIGGEGNGGVILPELHYGRDSLVGIALFLTYLAKKKIKVSELKKTYPQYFMSKNKIQLTPQINVDKVLADVKEIYQKQNAQITDIDGVKIDLKDGWVHLRKSNTEPIIRIYTESTSQQNADNLAQNMINQIKNII